MLALALAALLLAPAGSKTAPKPATPPAKAEAAIAEPVRADEALRRAVNEYAYGNYEATIDQLRALLYPMRLVSDAQVIEARKYLGLSYYLSNRPAEMREELGKLLYLEPDYQLDPFSIPPPIIEAFEEIRATMKPQLDVIRLRRSEAQNGSSGNVRRIIEPTLLPPPQKNDLVTFLPFGVGQLQNGDNSLALFFGLSEAVLLGVNIAAFLYATYGVGDDYPASDHGLVRGLQVTQYASLSLFAIMWGVGVYQARLQLTPSIAPRSQGQTIVPTVAAPAYDSTALGLGLRGGITFSLDF